MTMTDIPPPPVDDDRLLTPREVARMFRVDPKTVTRWCAAGKLSRVLTPGGHTRIPEAEVRALLAVGAAVNAELTPGGQR